MNKFPLHPTELRIGLNAGNALNKSNWLLWVLVIAAVGTAVYFIVKKYRNEEAKQ